MIVLYLDMIYSGYFLSVTSLISFPLISVLLLPLPFPDWGPLAWLCGPFNTIRAIVWPLGLDFLGLPVGIEVNEGNDLHFLWTYRK